MSKQVNKPRSIGRTSSAWCAGVFQRRLRLLQDNCQDIFPQVKQHKHDPVTQSYSYGGRKKVSVCHHCVTSAWATRPAVVFGRLSEFSFQFILHLRRLRSHDDDDGNKCIIDSSSGICTRAHKHPPSTHSALSRIHSANQNLTAIATGTFSILMAWFHCFLPAHGRSCQRSSLAPISTDLLTR